MIAFFANIFGYLLNFLYNLIGVYGIAIILFSVVIKLIMLPLSIKQQKTVQKNSKIQNEMKQIQFKYKNDPEKMNQEIIELYRREKMSPFSGCLSAILQIVLLFSVFYMVKEPLTYMKKVDTDTINYCVNILNEEGLNSNNAYTQIAVISELDKIKEVANNKAVEENTEPKNLDNLSMNMNFLGIDLSKVPSSSMGDYKAYIIPILYVISSFISMRMTTSTQQKNKKQEDGDEKKKQEEVDPMEQANKNMSLIMPIMSISISIIAPLGLALYWLTNNILMIVERLVLNKVLKDKEEMTNE